MKSTLSVLDKWEKKKKDVTEIISDKVDIKLVMSWGLLARPCPQSLMKYKFISILLF